MQRFYETHCWAALAFAFAIGGSAKADGAPAHPSPARPANPPTDWVGADDYPPGAWQAHTTGVVKFDLTIGIDGAPTACEITVSSGNADLDNGTCALLLQRANFVPALDDRGIRAIGHYRNSVRWDLPAHTDPHFDAGHSRLEYDVETDGVVNHCRMEPHPLAGALDMCHILGYVEPYRNASGKPERKHVTMTIAIDVVSKP